jgi:hypothetical protein
MKSFTPVLHIVPQHIKRLITHSNAVFLNTGHGVIVVHVWFSTNYMRPPSLLPDAVDVPRLNVGSNIQTKDRNVNGEKGNLIRRGRLTKQAIPIIKLALLPIQTPRI